MTTLEQAARQALEALENVRKYDKQNLYGLDDEIVPLRQALEQQPCNFMRTWILLLRGNGRATPAESIL